MQNNKSKTPTSCYCLKICRATASVTKHYDSVLAPSGVTVRQYSLLRNIANAEQCSISELADMTELDRSTLSRNLKPLFHQDLVANTKQPGTRNHQLELTEVGKETLAYAKLLWAEAQKDVMLKLGDEGLDALEKILGSLEAL